LETEDEALEVEFVERGGRLSVKCRFPKRLSVERARGVESVIGFARDRRVPRQRREDVEDQHKTQRYLNISNPRRCEVSSVSSDGLFHIKC